MIARPRQVRVWATQLAHSDFPPVCAMTGRPAETWRKFTFSTLPAWAYALLVLVCVGLLGIIIFAIVSTTVSLRASGHLPLTRSSRRLVNLAIWIPAGLIIGSTGLMTGVVIAAFANIDAGDPNAGTIAGLAFLFGGFVLVAGLVGRLLIAPLLLPRAKVEEVLGYSDRIVELRNVSPAFAMAVQQVQQQRAAPVSNPPASEVN